MRRITDGDVQQLASSRLPAYAHMYASLGAAVTGNWAALRQDFTIACTGDRRRLARDPDPAPIRRFPLHLT